VNRLELHETLTAFATAVEPPPSAELRVTEAEFDLPLEISTTTVRGRLAVLASLPHTRWRTGVLPRLQRASLRVELLPDAEEGHAS
jgi:hypothetical protein